MFFLFRPYALHHTPYAVRRTPYLYPYLSGLRMSRKKVKTLKTYFPVRKNEFYVFQVVLMERSQRKFPFPLVLYI